MTAAPTQRISLLETSPLITALCLIAVAVVVLRVVLAVPYLGAHQVVVDFDAFYIVGQMIWEGALASAYDPAVTRDRQSALAGEYVFMPWTYPPQFDLLVALLPFGERGLSYALFTLASFALFVWPVWRLAGRYRAAVLFATVPMLSVNAYVGQNGFLTGGLMGLFALAWVSRQDRAGIALGLMVIKPHLALAAGTLALVTPRLGVVAWAAAGVVLSTLAATLAFGPDIWGAFLEGASAAKMNLSQGRYPLHRMTSVYAAAYTHGLGASLSLALHGAVAVAALAAVVWTARCSGWQPRRVLGLVMLLSLVISPYNYDYDTTLLTVGLALLASDLIEGGRPSERALILALAWVVGGAGLTLTLARSDAEALIYGTTWFPPSLGAFAYLPLLALVVLILQRQEVAAQATKAPA